VAFSTRKKNVIIADWKTGAFTKKELEKKHKTTFKTLAKLLDGISADNADAVVVLHEAEMIRNSIKNPVELKAVENVVKHSLKVTNMTTKVLDKLDAYLDKGKAQKVVTEGMGMGASKATVIETDLQAKDFKDAIETIDKASITLNVNERHANSKVEVNNQNQQINNNLKVEWK